MRVLSHFALWAFGLASAETQTTEAERDCLASYASGRKRLAEIGVWHGVTTRRLRNAMAPDATLFAIDPYPPGRLGFSMQRIIAGGEVLGVSKGIVYLIRETGADAARKLAGSAPFDFVFLDGDHSYEGLKADWAGWKPLLARGGVIALHDSRSTPDGWIAGAGSVEFTSKVILRDPEVEVVDTVDSLTVLRRVSSRI